MAGGMMGEALLELADPLGEGGGSRGVGVGVGATGRGAGGARGGKRWDGIVRSRCCCWWLRRGSAGLDSVVGDVGTRVGTAGADAVLTGNFAVAADCWN